MSPREYGALWPRGGGVWLATDGRLLPPEVRDHRRRAHLHCQRRADTRGGVLRRERAWTTQWLFRHSHTTSHQHGVGRRTRRVWRATLSPDLRERDGLGLVSGWASWPGSWPCSPRRPGARGRTPSTAVRTSCRPS